MDEVKKLHGLYRGIVQDNRDSTKKRRVKAVVQTTGITETTGWAWPVLSTKRPPAIGQGVWIGYVGGDPEYPFWIGEFGESPQGDFCHGAWHNTQSMYAAVANTAYPMQCNVKEIEQGVTLIDMSKMKVEQDGNYNIQFSAQFDKASANTKHAWIWLRKNGVDVPYSASNVAIQGSTAEFIAAWNFFAEAKAGDYFEVVGAVDDTSIFLPAIAPSGIIPGIPSVILTINQIA